MIKQHAQKPILFATLGFPGSGKTYFSRKFSKEFHILHLNSDRIRKAMFKEPKYTQYENNYLFATMDALAEDALRNGISVIYDANSSLRIYRKRMIQMVKSYGARFFLLRFQTPVSVAKKRLGTRKRCTRKVCQDFHPPIPMKELFRLKDQIEEPTSNEPTIFIIGTDTYARQRNAVIGALKNREW
ncbi:ATP-binding protein [Candidatus Uhrbacteria bacterium]|nr:ATP-binding protein [Candidatus Uhrbacteria bacterium]